MKKKKRFQIVTYFTDSGFDDKEDTRSIAEARKIVSKEHTDADGPAVWDRRKKAYRRVCGIFPTEERILDYALVY